MSKKGAGLVWTQWAHGKKDLYIIGRDPSKRRSDEVIIRCVNESDQSTIMCLCPGNDLDIGNLQRERSLR